MTNPPQTRFQTLTRLLSSGTQADHLLATALLLIREEMAVNRAAILLTERTGKLKTVCSAGIPALVTSQAQLSLDKGIGSHLSRTGRILRYENSDETARKEMDLFGIKAAVPIFGQGKLAGGILLDCHLTGESLTNGELTELFFFLEKLGESVCAARANSEAICAFIEGLAHHLGNAAVPIATRMQLAAEGKGIELDQEAKDGIAKIGQITTQLRRTAQEHREEKTNVIESILRATQPSTQDH